MFVAVGCDRGWTRSGPSCYKVFPVTQSLYTSAQDLCQSNGANLASIETETENLFLKTLLDDARSTGVLGPNQDVWLGAKRPDSRSNFMWNSGFQTIFSDWGDHFGSQAEGPEDLYYDYPALCLQMFKNANPTWRWGVANCDGHDIDNEIVCEKTSEGMIKFLLFHDFMRLVIYCRSSRCYP